MPTPRVKSHLKITSCQSTRGIKSTIIILLLSKQYKCTFKKSEYFQVQNASHTIVYYINITIYLTHTATKIQNTYNTLSSLQIQIVCKATKQSIGIPNQEHNKLESIHEAIFEALGEEHCIK